MKTYQEHIPCKFADKVACIDDRFSELVVLYREKNATTKVIETILKEYDYFRKVIKKHCNKNLAMTTENVRRFKWSNKSGICGLLFAEGGNKVGDHDQVTGKYRFYAHWKYNINL